MKAARFRGRYKAQRRVALAHLSISSLTRVYDRRPSDRKARTVEPHVDVEVTQLTDEKTIIRLALRLAVEMPGEIADVQPFLGRMAEMAQTNNTAQYNC